MQGRVFLWIASGLTVSISISIFFMMWSASQSPPNWIRALSEGGNIGEYDRYSKYIIDRKVVLVSGEPYPEELHYSTWSWFGRWDVILDINVGGQIRFLEYQFRSRWSWPGDSESMLHEFSRVKQRYHRP